MLLYTATRMVMCICIVGQMESTPLYCNINIRIQRPARHMSWYIFLNLSAEQNTDTLTLYCRVAKLERPCQTYVLVYIP
jgi:hypothetical protein